MGNETSEMWRKGIVDTGYVDLKGQKIEQFDLLSYEDEDVMVLYSVAFGKWVAYHEEGCFIDGEDFNQTLIKEKGWGLKLEEEKPCAK